MNDEDVIDEFTCEDCRVKFGHTRDCWRRTES